MTPEDQKQQEQKQRDDETENLLIRAFLKQKDRRFTGEPITEFSELT